MVSGQQTPQRGVRVSMQGAPRHQEGFGVRRPLSAIAQVAAAPRLATGCRDSVWTDGGGADTCAALCENRMGQKTLNLKDSPCRIQKACFSLFVC